MRDPENMPGTVLGGRYQLDQARGEATQSASGATQFDATDLSSHEEVSVRVVPLSRLVDPALGSTTPADAQSAFEQQADIASSLRHPCIETVLDHGEAILDGEKYVYVVGERLSGGSLREFLDRGRRLTPSQALIVGVDVCRALDAAAKVGITHGDLRPSRLVFGLDKRVRLVGFGAPLKTLDSLGLEQAIYSAPELAEGGARGASSDIYSLALILIEAMTGDVPFTADTVAAAFTNRAGKLLPVSADFGALAQVLERAGRPESNERFSPREMGQALVQAAEKMARPTPIDIVGGGMFDDVESDSTTPKESAPSDVVASDATSAPNTNEPILIRTTPKVDAPTGPTPIAIIDSTESLTTPITIGGDDTGPIVLDADTLSALAAEDETTQVVRPKKRWGRRLIIAAVALVLIAGVGVGAYFTVLNPKNPVPQLVGLTEAEARNQVSQFGWTVEVLKERSDTVAAGQIISTNPVLGVNVAKRSTLTLVVSEGPTLSQLSEINALTFEAASAALTELGLKAEKIDVPDEVIAPGVVVSWSIPDQPTLKAGDSVVKGTTVAVNVSSGPALRDIPNLVGKTLEEATKTLTDMGLVVVEAPTLGHPEIPAGQISIQVPVAGEKLARGGTVTLTVSKGQVTTLIPSIYGKDFATVKARLEKYGMVIGKVTGNKNRGLKSASIDGKVVRNLTRVVVGKTVDLTFP
jgi:eukaryotic-like serine/threonine-protein kinase